MRKDSAIRYLSILPIPFAFWFIGGFLCPLGKSLAGVLHESGGELPMLSQYVMRISTSSWALPVHSLVGFLIAGILLWVGQNDRTRALFPLILSLLWALIFMYTSVYMMGVSLPFSWLI